MPHEQGRFQAVPYTQFLEHVGHVVFDGSVAEVKLGADFLVAEALPHEQQDFILAAAQVLKHAALGDRFATAHIKQELGAKAWRNILAIEINRAQGLDQFRSADALQHIALGAHPQGAEHICLISRYCQHEHFDFWIVVHDGLQRIQPAAWNADIEHQDIQIRN